MSETIGPFVCKPGFIEAEISGEAIRNYERYEKLAAQIDILEQEKKIFVENYARLEVSVTQLRQELEAFKQEMTLLKNKDMERNEKNVSVLISKEQPMMWEGGIGKIGNEVINPSDIALIVFLDSLEKAPEDAIDVSDAENCSVLAWTEYKYSTRILYIAGEGGVKANPNCSGMFAECSSLRGIEFGENFNTSGVTNMSSMFWGCERLKEINLMGFDTSNVTNMSSMFWGCERLKEINVTGFDTSNVTNMGGMFGKCRSLRKVNVTGFDTANVTNMMSMFEECWELTKIDVTSFDTSKVEDMKFMFQCCCNLEDITGLRIPKETLVEGMFKVTRLEANPPFQYY